MLAASISAYADENSYPVHRLSINFNLQEHQLIGISRIALPAGNNIELQLDMFTVVSIKINGKEIESQLTNGLLTVSSSSSDQEIEISFINNWPSERHNHNLIGADGIVLTDIWHPIANRDMLFKLTAMIPSEFSAISEAEEIITFPNLPDASEKQVVFRFPYPLRTIHFVAGPYVVEEETFSDGKILSSYFFPEDQELSKVYHEKARHYLDRYEKLLGPYPYSRFTIVENRLPTGFAMPTFTLLGQAVVRLPFIKDTSLGHEVLHAWFGNSIRIDMAEGNWAEGLTAYLADHAFALDQNRDTIYRKEQLIKYRSYVHVDNSLSLKGFTGAADELPTKDSIRAIGYSKSAMFFHMLKNTVGEKNFQEALRDFYSRMKYQPAGWSDLLVSFEKTAHIKLEPFFNQWLTRTDIPALTVQKQKILERDGKPLLSFQMIQLTAQPYQLTVPFIIKTTQGHIKKNVTLTDTETLIDIPLTASPTELILDADYDLMRELEPSELPPTWSRFIGATSKLAIIAPADTTDLFAPFVELLKDMNCRIIQENEATDADVSAAAVIFLGTDGAVSRSLFAKPSHPGSGFTVDIRNNPINAAHVAVLVSSQDLEETTRAITKLSHYGKYSYLHFENGLIQDKRVAETTLGQRFILQEIPAGIATQASRSFTEIIRNLLDNRVIYIGETHTNYADHVLQLQIIRALYEHDPHLAIGMEMFSKPSQPVLDDYIDGRVDEKEFLKQSKYFKQWSFDYRLYRDIVNFARRHRIPIVALNLEKKIVNNIFQKSGTDSLSNEEKEGLTKDRDLDMPRYRERLTSVYQLHSPPANGPEKGFSGFLQAQALWDETMAESVVEYLIANPDDRMVVLVGRGHTLKDTGIPPRVYRRTQVKQAVVLNIDSKEIESEKADYLFFSSQASLPPPAILGVMLEETEEEEGVTVAGLSPRGQAKEAGVKKKDIILAIDGEHVKTVADVKIIMLYKEKNDSVQVLVKRPRALFSDEELEIEIFLKGKPYSH